MNILLVCAAGLSTSLVVGKMKNCLNETQKNWRIEAHPIENLEDLIDQFDVILLGPQISHKLKSTQQVFASTGKPIDLIPSFDYAMADGKKILQKAIQMYQEGEMKNEG